VQLAAFAAIEWGQAKVTETGSKNLL